MDGAQLGLSSSGLLLLQLKHTNKSPSTHGNSLAADLYLH